ncbi:hypothetical protein AB0873_07450 [Micromonospora sp. NPDC047707]|uniref:hypothetical protein n=1 Tax=Micromonospora sp. NPDC047707 TaxID=3154498 RepID=UPI0034511777
MTGRTYAGLFVAEGSSDRPLADHVQLLFLDRGVDVNLSHPPFDRLTKVGKDVRSRVAKGLELMNGEADLIVVHRDADAFRYVDRLKEITTAVRAVTGDASLVPIIPVTMTEAWLLLDEAAIRHVAGNPNGHRKLDLPKLREVEGLRNPKKKLEECILAASEESGRRRERVKSRFDEHRRQLLERLDRTGLVRRLDSWQRLVEAVDQVVKSWR